MIMVNLLPLIVGAALLPLWIIMTLLLLRGEGGVIKAATFAAGAMVVRVLKGALFGYVFGVAAHAEGEKERSIIASTLLLVVGIIMLITAVTTWLKEDDPDAPPPKWMATLSRMSPLTAFGMGALMMAISIKQWVFTLSAIAVIYEAPLGQTARVMAYLLFVVAAQSLWCWRPSSAALLRPHSRP